MKAYIITNKVHAEPMTRLAYNIYRGWELPADENGDDEGYLIVKECGNESWQPKELFERSALLNGDDSD